MIRVTADKNSLLIGTNETLTSGSLNVNYIKFTLSADWDDLDRVVCFRIKGKIPTDAEVTAVDAYLDEDLMVAVPWEMTRYIGATLQVGIYGVKDGQVILPTVWGTLGEVKEGVLPSTVEGSDPPEIIMPSTGGLNKTQVRQLIREEIGALTNKELEDIINGSTKFSRR